jgi:uncharacterized membrane protein SirB2
MVFGMSLATYTVLHTILSLIGIAAGIVALFGMLGGKLLKGWTWIFLLTTILTSVTGYGFPVTGLMPSHIVGAISLVVLAIALYALYGRHLSGAWRWIYVVTAVIALYLNSFVGVFQAFLKLPALHALAPTQSEPPFQIAQLATLVIYIVLGFLAVRKFRPVLD